MMKPKDPAGWVLTVLIALLGGAVLATGFSTPSTSFAQTGGYGCGYGYGGYGCGYGYGSPPPSASPTSSGSPTVTPSSTPTTSPSPTPTSPGSVKVNSDVTINDRHGSLIIFGRVDADRKFCEKRARVKVQKKKSNGRWKTKATDRTNRKGRYKVEFRDKVGKYRAKVPRFVKRRAGQRFICKATKATLRHRH